MSSNNHTTKLWSGLMLIILGLIFLLEEFFPELDFEDFWPVLLIISGIIMIFSGLNYKKENIVTETGVEKVEDV